MDECMPQSSGWIQSCQQKTITYIMQSLIALTIEVLWFNICPIIAIAAVTYIILSKVRTKGRPTIRNGFRAEVQRVTDRQADEREHGPQQSQKQSTLIEIHANKPTLRTIPKPKAIEYDRNTPFIDGTIKYQATSTPNTPTVNPSQSVSRRKSVSFVQRGETTSESESSSDPTYRPSRATITKIKGKRAKRSDANNMRERLEREWQEQNTSDIERVARSTTVRNRRSNAQLNEIDNDQINIQIAAANTSQRDTANYIGNVITKALRTPVPMNCPAPPKFRHDLNIHEWIEEINNYIAINNWDGKKKSIYWMFMDTTTRAIINEDSLDDNEDRAIEQIKDRLIEIYGSQERSSMEKIKEFTSRKQKNDENVRMYSADLEVLVRRTFPRITTQEQEQYVISLFIDGILNNQLKIHLAVNRPPNIKAMVATAAKYENAFFKTREAATRAQSQNNQRQSNNNHQPPPTQPIQQSHIDNQSQNFPPTRAASSNPMIGNYEYNRIPQQLTQPHNNLNNSRY